jgi:hypothetical protein
MNLGFRILSLTQASRFDTVTIGLNKEGTIAYEIDNEYCIIDSEDGTEINYWYGFMVFQLR